MKMPDRTQQQIDHDVALAAVHAAKAASLPPQSDHDAALAAAHAAKVDRKRAKALQAEQTRAPRERG
jgi:hypothetical protein